MSDRDNPFGPPPPDDPFGGPPETDPFGNKAAGDDPFSAPSQGATTPNEPWRGPAPPHDPFSEPPRTSPGRAEGAIPALVLGILGIVFCPLCGPFAWFLGRKAEGLVDASGGTLSGRGEATAGKILGIIACVLMVLGVIALIALIAVGSSIDTSSTFESGLRSDGAGSSSDVQVD